MHHCKIGGAVMTDNDHLLDQAQDVYCHGIARIDTLGPNRRLVFTIPSIDSSGYQNVVVKLILPAELMVTLAYLAIGARSQRLLAGADRA